MRITQNSMNRTQLMGLNDSLGRLQKTQEQLTTGKRLNRPSDDPVGTVTAMRLKDQQRTIAGLGQNIEDGLSRLQSADDALTRTSTMLTKIRTLVVAGANGVNGPGQRNAYAQEVDQIREGMVQLANTKYAGQSVFGGTSIAPNAYDPVSGAFLGNTADVLRKVTEAEGAAGDVNIALPGSQAFAGTEVDGVAVSLFEKAVTLPNGEAVQRPDGSDTKDGLIAQVVQHLRSGDVAALQNDLTALDDAADKLTAAQSTIGARVNRLTQLQDVNGRADDAATAALSKIEDTDFMKAAMDLSVQSNAYNAALQASAKILQPSLMDFLR